MKICVVTSYAANEEPRAPRHAVAARRAFPSAQVTLVDHAPANQESGTDPTILFGADVQRHTLRYPTRRSNAPALLWRKLSTAVSRAQFQYGSTMSPALFGERVQGLTEILRSQSADIYIAHNIETLLPAFLASNGAALVMFDSMEYYSNIGGSQSALDMRAAQQLQQRLLPKCSLVLASSDELADVLAREHAIQRPLPTYNVPPTLKHLPARVGGGLNLYWRNSVLDFGQRGLDDAFVALSMLHSDVRLFIQGRLPSDGSARLLARAASLGITRRVELLPPYAPHEAVNRAAPYDIGLCLERLGPRNHELTVSNKMFDYHMGGLAVVSSDMPSLRNVITRSRGGLIYKAGNPHLLAEAISRLHASSELLASLQENARAFALREGNLETELERISLGIQEAIASDHKQSRALA